jgi:hypothetical protein
VTVGLVIQDIIVHLVLRIQSLVVTAQYEPMHMVLQLQIAVHVLLVTLASLVILFLNHVNKVNSVLWVSSQSIVQLVPTIRTMADILWIIVSTVLLVTSVTQQESQVMIVGYVLLVISV